MRFPVEVLRSTLGDIADLFLPPHCAICGNRTDGQPICDNCSELFEKDGVARCSVCNTVIDSLDNGCPIHGHGAYRFYMPAFHFGDEVRESIHMLKYSSRRDIGHYLASFVARLCAENGALDRVDALLPVPLHSVRKRDRGYNQSEVIAERISSEMGIPIERKAVVRTRNTKSQTKLGAAERAKNIAGAFRAKKDLTGKRFAIIDDVITTGATTGELANAVIAANGEVRCAICIASPDIEQSKENQV
jgi:ComF family protein